MQRSRARFWIESGLAVASAVLLVMTLFTRTWIENVFHVDPDAGSGALEWIIVGLALTVTVTAATLATREWRHRRAVTA